jgi:hypothetical protein
LTTLDIVLKTHIELCDEARKIVSLKGHDYNRQQQNDGDTLFNMTVCEKLGIVDTTTQGILVRLSDKLMRLISLTKYPNVDAQVKDESIRDTIKDTINYMVYLYIKYEEVTKNETVQGEQYSNDSIGGKRNC